MRRLSATLLLFAVSAAIAALPPDVIELPAPAPGKWAEVKATPGRILRLSATGPAKWLLVDDQAADLEVCGDGKRANFAAPRPGRYRLIVTADKGEPSRVVVVVGDAPPEPDPPPPPKPDALKKKLQEAYVVDKGEAADARQLAALYRQAVKLAADKTIPTTKELLRRVRVAGESLVEPGTLSEVRKVVAGELAVVLGAPSDDPITDGQRLAAAAVFGKLAEILEGF